MKITIKKILATLVLTGIITTVNASTCSIVPGGVTCGHGSVDNLSGNGVASVNGTTILGETLVNGLLNAEDATFFSLEVSGSTKLVHCIINGEARIKGSLTATSTKFEQSLEVSSGETHLINSKIGHDLHIGHTDSRKQTVYLDDVSEVAGNIVFDDGQGEVIIRSQSKMGGKIIGGHRTLK